MYKLVPNAEPSLLSSFSGDRRFSRFGGVLHLTDLDNDGLGKKGSLDKLGPTLLIDSECPKGPILSLISPEQDAQE